MRYEFSRRACLTAFAGGLLLAASAFPRDAMAEDAGAFIQNLGSQAIQVLGPQVPVQQRVAVFRRLLAGDFDIPGFARFVLGPYSWNLTSQQNEEFVQLLNDALARSYAEKLAPYGGSPFRVTGVRPMGGETVVTSEVMGRDGPPVRIDWNVVDHGGRLLVADVLVNGVSQKLSERNQFAAVIQRSGGRADALLAALRERAGEGGTGYGSTARPGAYR